MGKTTKLFSKALKKKTGDEQIVHVLMGVLNRFLRRHAFHPPKKGLPATVSELFDHRTEMNATVLRAVVQSVNIVGCTHGISRFEFLTGVMAQLSAYPVPIVPGAVPMVVPQDPLLGLPGPTTPIGVPQAPSPVFGSVELVLSPEAPISRPMAVIFLRQALALLLRTANMFIDTQLDSQDVRLGGQPLSPPAPLPPWVFRQKTAILEALADVLTERARGSTMTKEEAIALVERAFDGTSTAPQTESSMN